MMKNREREREGKKGWENERGRRIKASKQVSGRGEPVELMRFLDGSRRIVIRHNKSNSVLGLVVRSQAVDKKKPDSIPQSTSP